MWCTQLRLSLLSLVFLALTACASQAPNNPRMVTVQPMTMPLTTGGQVVFVPSRYVNCSVVPGRWIYSTWIPEHHVCTYSGGPRKVYWVEGYYACTSYNQHTGRCLDRVWQSPQWHHQRVSY